MSAQESTQGSPRASTEVGAEVRSEVPASEFQLEASTADIDVQTAKRVLEAVLLASQEPLSAGELRRVFEDVLSLDTVRKLLEDLRNDWQGRGVELVQVASGWRFQTRLEFQKFIERLKPERPVRYSRAVMETLAIIAYRQPVTRGDIEDIRGVTVSSQILKTLEARGWIDVIGHKEVPGRPALYATTKALLDDLNLRTLEELPSLTQLDALEATAAGIELSAAGIELSAASIELSAASVESSTAGVGHGLVDDEGTDGNAIAASPDAEVIASEASSTTNENNDSDSVNAIVDESNSSLDASAAPAAAAVSANSTTT